jgi:hypothetical protein
MQLTIASSCDSFKLEELIMVSSIPESAALLFTSDKQ